MLFEKDRYTREEVKAYYTQGKQDGKQEEKIIFANEKAKLVSDHEIKIAELESAHKIELRQKEFDINHKNDDDKLKLTQEKTELEKQLAVANETIRQLDKIVDLNADVIDVKDLVKQLIGKLPTLNITSLSVPPQTGTN